MSLLPTPFKIRKLSDNSPYIALEWNGKNHAGILEFMREEDNPVLLEAMPIGAYVIKRQEQTGLQSSWLVITPTDLNTKYSKDIDKYTVDVYEVHEVCEMEELGHYHKLRFVDTIEVIGTNTQFIWDNFMKGPNYSTELTYIACYSDGYVATLPNRKSINRRFT